MSAAVSRNRDGQYVTSTLIHFHRIILYIKFKKAELVQTRALRSLIKISQVQSFRLAAEQLGMTLSALSMQMKSLEEALGVALFDRSARPPRLTPIGRAVVSEAVPLLHQEERISEICHPSGDLTGHYRLGFVTTAAVRLLPGFLKTLSENAPRASFEFETGLSAVLQNKVLTGQLDAAVITDAEGLPSQLSFRVLRQEPFVFAAHASLLRDGLPGLLSESAFFHFMPHTGIGKLIEKAMLDYARPSGARTIVMDNLEAIMECVSSGLGYTLLPVPDVERYRIPEVQTIAATHSLRRKLVLVFLKNSALDRNSAKFAALLGA